MRVLALLLSGACVLAFLHGASALAFSTETMNNSNSDGSPKFVDPDEQLPFGNIAGEDGSASVYTFKVPDLGATMRNAKPESFTLGTPWDPQRMRLLFGPFNHFGYGGSPAQQ